MHLVKTANVADYWFLHGATYIAARLGSIHTGAASKLPGSEAALYSATSAQLANNFCSQCKPLRYRSKAVQLPFSKSEQPESL